MPVGEVLRRTREEKGISLADVEEETKIRRKYIVALENDDFDVLPGKVYVKGFLRNYARFLGLDGEELVGEYQKLFPSRPETEPVLENMTPTGFDKPAGSRRRLVAIAAVLLVGAIFYWWSAAGPAQRDELSGNGREQNLSTGQQDEGNGAGDAGERSGPAPGGQDDGTEPGTVERGINVVLEVTNKDCWMQVIVDGRNTFEGLVQPGNTKEFMGRERVWLKLGDAGAVRVQVNGNDYGYLGEQGMVVTRTFEAGESGGATVGG